MWGPSRNLGSLTAANWVSFNFNVSYSSCRGYSLINTLNFLKKKPPKDGQQTDFDCEVQDLLITLGGADFEFIPTNNILPAHHLWAGSLHFPPRAGCHAASSMAGKSAQENMRPIRDIKTGQDTTHLWDPNAAVGELGGDASLPLAACIAFPRLALFHKTCTKIWLRKLAQILYLGVSPFCTRSRGLVLVLRSLPHRVN